MKLFCEQVLSGVPAEVVASQVDDDLADPISYAWASVSNLIQSDDAAHRFEFKVYHTDDLVDSGTIDYACFVGARAHITDYKFGWLPLKLNAVLVQLSHYALLVFHNFPDVDEVIVQAVSGRTRQCFNRSWKRKDVPKLLGVVTDAVKATQHPEPWTRLSPSRDACEHCKGAICGACPAFMSQARALVLPSAVKVAERTDVERWLEFGPLVEKAYHQAKTQAKAMMRDGVEFDKWELLKRRSAAKIVDIRKFMALVKSFGVTVDDVLERVTIGKAHAEEIIVPIVQKQKGGTKKDAAKLYYEKIDPCISRGDDIEYIQRKK
jgi:hypothetical protein